MPTRGNALAFLAVCLVVAGCGGSGTTDGGTSPATTYTISGTVGGAATAGVTVSLSGSSTASTTSDAAGVFSFTGLSNGSYTVTPTQAGFTFSPTSSPVTVSGANVSGQNFTSTAVVSTYSISGTVSGATASGVTVTLGGASSAITTTSGTGTYTLTGVANGSYTLTPSLAGYTFFPTSIPVTVSGANVSGQNFTATAVGNNFQTALQGTWESCNPRSSGVGTSEWQTVMFSGLNYTATGQSFPNETCTGTRTLHVTAEGTFVIGAAVTVNLSSTPVSANQVDATKINSDGSTETYYDLWYVDATVTPNRLYFGDLSGGSNNTPAKRPTTLDDTKYYSKQGAATYSISGAVSGAVASGVTITLSGASAATTTTGGTGAYTITGLANGTYTVTPSLVGYTFSPTSSLVTVNGAIVSGQNFTVTAVPTTYGVSGTVSGAVASGVTIALSGASGGTATTDSSGVYSFTGLVNGSYTVTPSLAGYAFSPASIPVTIGGASVSGQNFTASLSRAWRPVSSGTTYGLYAVWGASSNDVWASGDFGLLLHWNGATWSQVASGTGQGLMSVWGASSSDVWAVGGSGAIVHWNGSAWTSVPSTTTQTLSSIWGRASNDVWAVGTGGAVVHWNGSSWSTVSSGTPAQLDGVWIASSTDAWLVGDLGTIRRWNGASWSSVPSGTSNQLNAVWGNSASDVWTCGAGEILHWNGSAWLATVTGLSEPLLSMWGSSATDVWAVGIGGAGRHWNGATWSSVSTGTGNHLWGVWGGAPNDVWAVGGGGTILHYTDVIPPPSSDTTPPTVSVNAPASGSTVSGTVTLAATASDTGSGVAYVQFKVNGLSTGNTITASPYQYNWNTVALANGSYTISASATDVAGNIGNSITVDVTVFNPVVCNPPFVSNTDNTACICPGDTHQEGPTCVPNGFRVSGTVSGSTYFGVAISIVGPVLKATTTDVGGAYSLTGLPNGTYTVTPSKRGFAFTPPSATVIVNAGDIEGVAFTARPGPTALPLPTKDWLVAVWGNSPTDVWAVGPFSQLHWNGTAWSRDLLSPTRELRGISGSSGNDVWFVGSQIKHWNGNSWWVVGQAAPGTYLRDVWVHSPYEAWIVGDGGKLIHFIGGSWRDVAPPLQISDSFRGVWGSSSTDVWAVGERINGPGLTPSQVIHWNGTSWAVFGHAGVGPLQSVRGSAADDVWAVGGFGGTIHWDGSSWSEVSSGFAGTLRGVWARSKTDAWAVGDGGGVLHWDGLAWSRVPTETTKDLYDVYGVQGDLYIVGDASLLVATIQTYGISGAIAGGPSDAQVLVDGPVKGQVKSGSNGAFAFEDLPNGNYSITPVREGFTFAPPNRNVTIAGANVSGVDFTATPNDRTVSGRITGEVAEGIPVNLSGPVNRSTRTDSGGYFTFSDLPRSTYVVQPYFAEYQFSPSSREVTVTDGNAPGQDFVSSSVYQAILNCGWYRTGVIHYQEQQLFKIVNCMPGAIIAVGIEGLTDLVGLKVYADPGFSDLRCSGAYSEGTVRNSCDLYVPTGGQVFVVVDGSPTFYYGSSPFRLYSFYE